MNQHLLFVYGTLRRGHAGAISIRFPGAKFIAEAKVNGALYDLGAYPGVLLNESKSLVVGEVYEVDDEILNELDNFEASSNYRRQQVVVSAGTRGKLCWIYVPEVNSDSDSSRRLIASGDWIEYATTKTDWPGKSPLDQTQS